MNEFDTAIDDAVMVSNSDDTAVKLGYTADAGVDPQNTEWSFCYNFVDSNRDSWEQNKSDSMNSIGPLLAAGGGTGSVIVRMNEDSPFRMLWMKFNVYYKDGSNSIHWYDDDAVSALWNIDAYFNQNNVGVPLHWFIKATLSIAAPDGRVLYGEITPDGITPTQNLKLSISTMQGYDYGMGQLYQPYLLPKQGIITLDLINTHPTKSLYVGGAIFGEKVRL